MLSLRAATRAPTAAVAARRGPTQHGGAAGPGRGCPRAGPRATRFPCGCQPGPAASTAPAPRRLPVAETLRSPGTDTQSRQNNLRGLNLSDRRRHTSPSPSFFPSLPGQSLRDSRPLSGSGPPRLPDGSAGRCRLPAAPRGRLFQPSLRDDIPIALRGESAPRGAALGSLP